MMVVQIPVNNKPISNVIKLTILPYVHIKNKLYYKLFQLNKIFIAIHLQWV